MRKAIRGGADAHDGTGPSTAGRLYLVATPIGNLEDVTLRALRVLGEVDFVLCEDTRHTRKLMSAHDLRAELVSLHDHNEDNRIPEILRRLRDGASAALVSDAGTPAVSDPGYRLVRALVDAGVEVTPLPGASAPVAALVASGLPTDRFAFYGYAPRKDTERSRFFADIALFSGSSVVFESPRRVAATLRVAADVLGRDRECVIARELTKIHEEFLRGPLGELLDRLPSALRGEVTLVFAPPPERPPEIPSADELRRRHRALLAAGVDPKEALRDIGRATGLRRRDVYEAVVLGAGDSTARADHTETDPDTSDGEHR